jgi:hypothetical protein
MWLYKRDYPWLKEAISQLPRPPKKAKEKVAWRERDSLFAAQVSDSAALLYQSNVEARISAARLARATGRQALIQKFSAKLPLTTQTIHMLEETVDAFQCRRVRRIVQERQARGEVPTRWRILRHAGLATPLAPAVEQELAALLSGLQDALEVGQVNLCMDARRKLACDCCDARAHCTPTWQAGNRKRKRSRRTGPEECRISRIGLSHNGRAKSYIGWANLYNFPDGKQRRPIR